MVRATTGVGGILEVEAALAMGLKVGDGTMGMSSDSN